MVTLITKAEVTREFLIEHDGKLTWTRWAYLNMRSILQRPSDPNNDLLDFLNHTADVKLAAELDGIRFEDTPNMFDAVRISRDKLLLEKLDDTRFRATN